MLKKKIISIYKLKPLEMVFHHHLKNVEKLVLKDSKMKKPIIIDKKNKIILDGSHRYAFLYKNGYKLAPVLEVDYLNESIFVGNHLHHRFIYDSSKKITKEEVVKKGLSGNLYKPRTTRHFFPFRKIDYPTNLEILKKGKIRNIDKITLNTSLKNEIKFNLDFINEIKKELSIIEDYVDEQKSTYDYLMIQNKLFKKTKNEK